MLGRLAGVGEVAVKALPIRWGASWSTMITLRGRPRLSAELNKLVLSCFSC